MLRLALVNISLKDFTHSKKFLHREYSVFHKSFAAFAALVLRVVS